ncbi:hypothetical protein N9544_03515 [Flavobacteriales bacterium]|nr:hypothetical protein [Flavobacteriales bacterium]
MNLFKQSMATLTVAIFAFSCSGIETKGTVSGGTFISENKETIFLVDSISELTDEQYPNNPDISIRSSLDGSFSHSKISFEKNTKGYDMVLYPKNKNSDTIVLIDLELKKFVPSVPTHVKKDEYLTKIGITNQEWNRMQVNFKEGQFEIKGNNLESQKVIRIDIARNCINAYLWELIIYTSEEGKSKPIYHGWFNFNKELYAQLFEEKNELTYSTYQASLEEWIFPGSEKVNLEILRERLEGKAVEFENHDNEYYPEIGERKKKKMNILFPKNVHTIDDFLTDSTTYATFSAPGCYNQSDPRKTQLHRLANLKNIELNTIKSNNTKGDSLSELVLRFESETDTTLFIVGGIDLSKLPILTVEESKNGYQMPMGIGNYSFYSNYSFLQNTNHLESPFYGLLTDENHNWLDSHEIGIDGPLLHYDKEGNLHFWILSFERHSFVGHYVVSVS